MINIDWNAVKKASDVESMPFYAYLIGGAVLLFPTIAFITRYIINEKQKKEQK